MPAVPEPGNALGRQIGTDRSRHEQSGELRACGDGPGMSVDTRAAAGPLLAVRRGTRPGRRLLVLGLLAAVVVLDQATKWWAWRHVSGAEINPGGDWLVGPTR